VTDFLDEKRREITQRLKELKPVVDEFRRLEAAVTALVGHGPRSSGRAGVCPTGPARVVTQPSARVRSSRMKASTPQLLMTTAAAWTAKCANFYLPGW
jgi:hypothetical protein